MSAKLNNALKLLDRNFSHMATPPQNMGLPSHLLYSEMEKFFGSILASDPFSFWTLEPFAEEEQEKTIQPYLDFLGNNKEYLVTVELPGVKEKDITVKVEGDRLIISGKKRQETEQEGKEKGFYHRERSYGSFKRVLSIPEDARHAEIAASFKDGVLKITLPRNEGAKALSKNIEITRAI